MNQELPDQNNRPIVGLKSKGFALVITLALVSFVFLLVISLISQVRMDLAYSDVRQDHILAKAHARMGMMIAIGEIQKHLGPDTRVTSTADLYDDRIESEKDYRVSGYPLPSTNLEEVNLYESGKTNKIELGQRQWTGVWKNRGGWAETKLPTPPLPENRDDGKALTLSWSYDSSYDPHPAVEQAWLVSGNERWSRKLGIMDSAGVLFREFIEVPDGIIIDDEGVRVLSDPLGGTYGNKENPWSDHKSVVEQMESTGSYHHPLIPLQDPIGPDRMDGSEQTTWLLKAPLLNESFESTNFDHQKNWKDYLVTEPVKVRKTALHFSDDKRNQEEDIDWAERSGSYAYWVGDEGVKAKINLMEPFKVEDDESITYLLDSQNKLKLASEPNINDGSYGFEYSSGFEKRKDLISALSIDDLLLNTSSSEIGSNYHYHSMTSDSFGVLADVRTGGLKRDLSQAFALSKNTSKAWEKDFGENFIFRDRVRAMKNIPLEADTMKNQWFVSANDATVDDPDALLAGPPWSVLAGYHNLTDLNNSLAMDAPDQFPRTVGDNALIFGRRAPGSPRNAFKNAQAAYPYFNCFSSSVRSIRPEPKNHPILPVFVKGRLSISPVATDSPGNFCLGINPAITLWNPYDKEMILNDLFVEIPFGGNGGTPSSLTCRVTQVDFKEYDLYRKWWAYIYGDFNASFELSKNDLNSIEREFSAGYIKNWKQPWGIYSFSTFKNTYKDIQSQPGLIDTFLQNSSPPLGSSINQVNWNNRVPPDSMYGIKLEGNTFYHENPRDGIGDYTFTFNSMTKEEFSFNRLFMRIKNQSDSSNSVTLAPGEVVTFAAFASSNAIDVQTNQPVASGSVPDPPSVINITRKPMGEVEKGYVWDSGFALNKDACAYVINMGGTTGYLVNTAEKYTPQGILSNVPWSNSQRYTKPNCFTIWQGDPNNLEESKVLTRLTKPSSINPKSLSLIDSEAKFSTNDYLQWNLEQSAQGAYQEKLFGLGWEVAMSMPGDLDNDRITFNEFNPRALVHSTQHGQGSWLKSPDIKQPEHYSNPPQLSFTPSPGPFSYSIDGKSFAFNVTDDQYLESTAKSTPDIFQLPTVSSEDPVPVNFNNNNLGTVARGNLLTLSDKGTSYGFDEDDNPDSYNDPVVDASFGQERIGFFNKDESTGSPYTGKFSGSTHAVMFETPKGKVLSLLQYRHANLNNYLHGPSYALGNSYATTQVARHRSWGRVQSVTKKPTSDGGMLSVSKNMEDEESAIAFYKNLLGDEVARARGFNNFIEWNIDPSQGFAPWRYWGADQLNHQNTTIDHSYYLNRALLDGYFLSGSKTGKDYSNENDTLLGQRFRPFLWDTASGQAFNPASHSDIVGNNRLVGYLRNGEWKDSLTTYNSQDDEDDYRYQTIAGDLLLEGAFNVNSTSVDAWIAQLSSLRGLQIQRLDGSSAGVASNETPVVRFLNEPASNNWNDLRTLTDEEIENLAKSLVKQVKLRGPFLSFADFVNRRLALGPMDSDPSKSKGTRVNFVLRDLNNWEKEDRFTTQGLRGAVQSAIAEAGLNDEGSWTTDDWIPKVPLFRYDSSGRLFDSSYGLRASALNSPSLDPGGSTPRSWGIGSSTQLKLISLPDVNGNGSLDSIRDDIITYPSTKFGEAPENLLAVEHLATGANKPGWVMQADLLSPLAPVSSARSDTFVIRVMGETNSDSPARAWIELVVQRTPDFVKPDIDPAHHRPHEPFKDKNNNGYWDNGFNEHWLDLNRNGDSLAQPDLPGVGELGRQKDYRDGMLSDLKLKMDPQEEDTQSTSQISYQGINQRFGRKFKIIRFRWLREEDV